MRARVELVVLVVAGLVIAVVGATGLLAPDALHAGSGLPTVDDPGLRSESRAAGALLLVLGVAVLVSARVPTWRRAGAGVAAVGLLAYAAGRAVSWGLDGDPGQGIAVAGLVELLLGVAAGVTALQGRLGARTADRVSSPAR